MSKKANKTQPEKKQIEIVDQQKDPMLRALQKKVRNINKKLNEIAQLSTKKDLKPEQEEKISKKNQITQEKEKYLQMIQIYKEISGESEKIIRKTQLAELEDLAHIIAAKEYLADLGFALNQNVDNLVRVLTTPTSNQLNLKQRVDEVSEALLSAANNFKLKKNLRQFVQANPERRKEIAQNTTQAEPVPSQSEKVRQPETKVVEPETKEEKVESVEVTPTLAASEVTVEQSIPVQPQPTQNGEPQKVEVVEEKPAAVVTVAEPQNTPTQAVKNVGQDQKEGGKQERRGYRGYRGRERPREERNGEKPNDEAKPYKKRNFKPKFDNEQKQRKESSSSSSLSDQEPKARQFKREEVRELIEDGFIVVGKPKIKAKDQREYYDHQHGKKHHHHQSKKNY